MSAISLKFKKEFPLCEMTSVQMLSHEDYIFYYANNYGQFGKLPLLLHEAYHGFRMANIITYTENDITKGWAVVFSNSKVEPEANYWVMEEYRKQGIGTTLRKAVNLLYRLEK